MLYTTLALTDIKVTTVSRCTLAFTWDSTTPMTYVPAKMKDIDLRALHYNWDIRLMGISRGNITYIHEGIHKRRAFPTASCCATQLASILLCHWVSTFTSTSMLLYSRPNYTVMPRKYFPSADGSIPIIYAYLPFIQHFVSPHTCPYDYKLDIFDRLTNYNIKLCIA